MFRRRVFYIPGFDPIPPRRYRELFRREGAAQAAISGYALTPATREDETGFGWAARAQMDGEAGHAEFEVLVWADIVQGSMRGSVGGTYLAMIRTAAAYIGSGALWRLMRLRRGPVLTALYPVAVLILQAIAAALAGAGLARGVAALGAPWWLAAILGAAMFWAVLQLWRRLDGRIFAYYLMHDYAFTAAQGGAYPPALCARLDAFAERIEASARSGDWDEVLVVGHSSGAYLAVSVLARIAREAGGLPGGIALLTLGHVVPMASFLPRADALRRDLHDLARAAPAWVDVTAPGDPCCFALCDPVAVSGCAPKGQAEGRPAPLVISAAFSRSMAPERLKALRWRFFRLHFQYLCAFEQPGDYDYFRITAGPQTLAERFAGRTHSPGRIAAPVNRWSWP
ncbi:MAG: hypothetical protein Q4F71_08850 [Paracoccus sp. (in: a-proteobacteria)]|nr:hypothetical protein [Paracoccus sp. (in: a-proteobacteria)]